MPTRKALRHSRRRNTDLRVFYFFITYAITSSLVFQIIPYTIDMLRLISKKIPGVTNTYDTRLISDWPAKCHRLPA